MTTLSILNGSGDTKITWEPTDPEQCESARQIVLALKAQGYTFFLVGGTPADEIAAGAGALVVRKLTAEEVVPLDLEPEAETAAEATPEPVKRGRGRPRKQAGDQRIVAVRPMQGG